MFSFEYCQIFKNIDFNEQLQTTASELFKKFDISDCKIYLQIELPQSLNIRKE